MATPWTEKEVKDIYKRQMAGETLTPMIEATGKRYSAYYDMLAKLNLKPRKAILDKKSANKGGRPVVSRNKKKRLITANHFEVPLNASATNNKRMALIIGSPQEISAMLGDLWK